VLTDIKLLSRPEYLDADSIKAVELLAYAENAISHETCVLCQAPGSFIKKTSITNGVEAVDSGLYLFAVGVRKLQTYCWHEGKALNYDPRNIPQTQSVESICIESSGLYVFNRDDYLKQGSGVASTPRFIELSYKESVDIDYPEDYSLAEALSRFNDESLDNTNTRVS